MSEYSTTRNSGLDLVRSVAILMVLVSHCRHVTDEPWHKLTFFGFLGVELFFVLSGFLVGTILIKNLSEEKTVTYFWRRRWFRTLPLYLVAVLALFWISSSLSLEYLFFGQGFTKDWRLMPVSWSLCVEEFFYLVLPLIVVMLKKFVGLRRSILLAGVVLFIVPLFVRIFQLQMEWTAADIRKFPFRFDNMAIGLFAAYAFYYIRVKIQWIINFGRVLLIAFTVGVSGFFYIFSSVEYDAANLVWFPLVAGFLGLIFIIGSIDTKFRVECAEKVVRFISMTSYSAYVWHWEVLKLLKGTDFSSTEKLMLFWITTFCISYFSYKLIEQTGLRVRERLNPSVG